MLYIDDNGIPLTILTESAQKAEVKLALQTIDELSIETRPLHPKIHAKKVTADKAYDAGWFREALRERGITPKIPKRKKKGAKEEPIYNETIADYYYKRWKVERTISWLGAYRRLLIRWEYHDSIYEAFVNIACMLICLRRL
jgi:transposase